MRSVAPALLGFPVIFTLACAAILPAAAQAPQAQQATPATAMHGETHGIPAGALAPAAPADADGPTPIPVAGQAGLAEQSPITVLPAESLGNDDLIEIMVPYCPELSRNFRVGSDGMLSLPLLHHPIPVNGLTPSEASTRIKDALVQEQVMADPIVNVAVLEYRSRPVSVIGTVVHPLTFQATGETTLLDAIAKAGGLGPGVGANILVTTRHFGPQGTVVSQVQTIPVHALVADGDPQYNIRLHGGEEIRIPEAGKLFVAGNVRRPGMYTMQGDEDTTVIKALALSEGLQQYSANVAYIYRRSKDGGARQEIPIPLSRIVARKDPDVALKADDILYVPENGSKRMTAKVLSQIAGFGSATATGMLIYK